MAEAPVADHVDDCVVTEAASEVDGQVNGGEAGLDVVGVDVHDWDVEAFGEVGGVARRAAVARVGGEADLVVGDQVQRSAGGVARETLQVEDFGDDALCAESGVAVHQDRHRSADFERRLGRIMIGLQRARPALDDGVDRFEMRWVGGKFDRDLALVERVIRPARTVMVLHVAADVFVVGALAARVGGFELGEQFLIRPVDDVRDGRKTAAVRHSDDRRPDTVGGKFGRDLFHHRDGHVESLDRERLLSDVRLAQEALEGFDFGQPRQHVARALRRERNEVGSRLDIIAQPLALLDVGDVFDLVGDRRTVRAAQLVDDVGQRAAPQFRAQHRSGDRRHDRRRQPVTADVERRIAGCLSSERIERRGEMAVTTIGGDDRHPRRDRAQQFVGVRLEFARRRRRLFGDGDRRLRDPLGFERAARSEPEPRKDLLVKALAAAQQFVDPFEKFTRLCALDHAMIVGARQRHDLLHAERFERRLVRIAEARRVADRAGCDDGALARHQAWHRGDGPDAAGIGQRETRADQIVGAELVVARPRDQLFVTRAKRREVERRGVLDDRDDQEARAVLALRIDGEAEMDAVLDALRRRAGPSKRCDDRRIGFGGSDQRVGDQVRK